ncbi:hypothetical protein BJX99DRAFT_202609 [Aspergillus californicus]
METITHAVQNAGNALWGQQGEQRQQHGEEPVSGIQGKGTVTDPYDAGNRDEQPFAPKTTSNTAVMTEPVSSTIPDRSHTTQTPSDKAALATSSIGSSNPSVAHPTPVSNPQKSSYGAGAATAGKSTLVDGSAQEELTRSSGARTTLKDNSKDHAWDVTPDNSTTARAPAADTASTALNNARSSSQIEPGLTTTHVQSQHQNKASIGETEQRDTSTSQLGRQSQPQTETQTQNKGSVGESEQRKSTTGQSEDKEKGKGQDSELSSDAVAEKKQVSKEALRGPSVAVPRDDFTDGKKAEDALKKKEDQQQGGQPQTGKSEQKKDDKSHGKDKDSKNSGKDEHHHKSLKEKISNIVHHHH